MGPGPQIERGAWSLLWQARARPLRRLRGGVESVAPSIGGTGPRARVNIGRDLSGSDVGFGAQIDTDVSPLAVPLVPRAPLATAWDLGASSATT